MDFVVAKSTPASAGIVGLRAATNPIVFDPSGKIGCTGGMIGAGGAVGGHPTW